MTGDGIRKGPSYANKSGCLDLYGDEILTVREAAALLKCSVPNIKRMIYARKLIASKLGKNWRIKKSEISSYLDINAPALHEKG